MSCARAPTSVKQPDLARAQGEGIVVPRSYECSTEVAKMATYNQDPAMMSIRREEAGGWLGRLGRSGRSRVEAEEGYGVGRVRDFARATRSTRSSPREGPTHGR